MVPDDFMRVQVLMFFVAEVFVFMYGTCLLVTWSFYRLTNI